MKTNGYAFISYSTKNQQMADSFRNLFNQNDIATWMAPGDIPFGSTYMSEINNAIKGSSCFVLLLSESAQCSQWVLRETERAVSTGKTIFTILLDDVPMNDDFEFMLSANQAFAIQKIDENDAKIKRLLSTVRAFTNELPQSTIKTNSESRQSSRNTSGVKSEITKQQNDSESTVRLICVVDTSFSMSGEKIDALNEALHHTYESLMTKFGSKAEMDILTYDSEIRWLTINDLPLVPNGVTNAGRALKSLCEYGKEISDSCLCAIVFSCDGHPNDSIDSEMMRIWQEKWFRRAVKIGIAIGDSADVEFLSYFTGSQAAVSLVRESEPLASVYQTIAFASVEAAYMNGTDQTAIEGRDIIDWLDNENIAEELSWKFHSDGTLEVVSGGVIRDFYGPKPHTPWERYNSLIQKVIIDQGVRVIGMHAFCNLPNLKEVTIPESVTDIRCGAFRNCYELTTVNVSRETRFINSFPEKSALPCHSLVIWPRAFENTKWCSDLNDSDDW